MCPAPPPPPPQCAVSVSSLWPCPGVEALEDLLLWLGTLTDLYSHPCSASGTLLAADVASQLLLPPLVRPYKLSHEQLQSAVADPSKRAVYHLHAAPLAIV